MAETAIQPATSKELADFLRENAAGKRSPVIPVGGGTWLEFGYPLPPGVELHTKQLAKVLDYPARDMTITVETGLTVVRLQEILRGERQQVPLDLALSEQATIGGAIAANAFGPRRYGSGTLRDYVIGISAADASGRTFHAGGRVVKNVAGYDLCKLMVGSWGTLAVLTEVTLKVTPLPDTQSWVWSTWNSPEQLENALAALQTSETRPWAVEVLNPRAAAGVAESLDINPPAESFVLAVLVAGSSRETNWQTQKLQEELARSQASACDVITGPAADQLLESLIAFAVTGRLFSFRAHLRPSRTVEFLDQATQAGFLLQGHAGNGVVTGHAPADLAEPAAVGQKLAPLRQLAEAHGGSLVITQCPAEWKSALEVFGSGHSSWPLMKKLKTSLDPHHLLSPGRLFAWDG